MRSKVNTWTPCFLLPNMLIRLSLYKLSLLATSLTSGGALPAGLVQVTQAQTPVQLQAIPNTQGTPPALVR